MLFFYVHTAILLTLLALAIAIVIGAVNILHSQIPPIETLHTSSQTNLEFDCDGRVVDRAITFLEFKNKFLKESSHCHNFMSWGFLYDEGGVYGFPDTTAGFKTKKDQQEYRLWRFTHRQKSND